MRVILESLGYILSQGYHWGGCQERGKQGEGQVTARLLVRDPVMGKSQVAGEPEPRHVPSSSEGRGRRSSGG